MKLQSFFIEISLILFIVFQLVQADSLKDEISKSEKKIKQVCQDSLQKSNGKENKNAEGILSDSVSRYCAPQCIKTIVEEIDRLKRHFGKSPSDINSVTLIKIVTNAMCLKHDDKYCLVEEAEQLALYEKNNGRLKNNGTTLPENVPHPLCGPCLKKQTEVIREAKSKKMTVTLFIKDVHIEVLEKANVIDKCPAESLNGEVTEPFSLTTSAALSSLQIPQPFIFVVTAISLFISF